MIALRFPFAAGLGGLLSLSLFFVLFNFVSRPMDIPPAVKGRIVDFTRLIKDTPPETKPREKPNYEPPPAVPDLPTFRQGTEGGGPGATLGGEHWQPVVDPGPHFPTRLNTDVIPLVRVNPDYPPTALARNIEGWVQVQYTVTATGTVREAKVVAAEPKGVFDQAALRAIARWRYNPMIEDGAATERVGLQTVIRFQLDR